MNKALVQEFPREGRVWKGAFQANCTGRGDTWRTRTNVWIINNAPLNISRIKWFLYKDNFLRKHSQKFLTETKG